jgi:hypothetical protein
MSAGKARRVWIAISQVRPTRNPTPNQILIGVPHVSGGSPMTLSGAKTLYPPSDLVDPAKA